MGTGVYSVGIISLEISFRHHLLIDSMVDLFCLKGQYTTTTVSSHLSREIQYDDRVVLCQPHGWHSFGRNSPF